MVVEGPVKHVFGTRKTKLNISIAGPSLMLRLRACSTASTHVPIVLVPVRTYCDPPPRMGVLTRSEGREIGVTPIIYRYIIYTLHPSHHKKTSIDARDTCSTRVPGTYQVVPGFKYNIQSVGIGIVKSVQYQFHPR